MGKIIKKDSLKEGVIYKFRSDSDSQRWYIGRVSHLTKRKAFTSCYMDKDMHNVTSDGDFDFSIYTMEEPSDTQFINFKNFESLSDYKYVPKTPEKLEWKNLAIGVIYRFEISGSGKTTNYIARVAKFSEERNHIDSSGYMKRGDSHCTPGSSFYESAYDPYPSTTEEAKSFIKYEKISGCAPKILSNRVEVGISELEPSGYYAVYIESRQDELDGKDPAFILHKTTSKQYVCLSNSTPFYSTGFGFQRGYFYFEANAKDIEKYEKIYNKSKKLKEFPFNGWCSDAPPALGYYLAKRDDGGYKPPGTKGYAWGPTSHWKILGDSQKPKFKWEQLASLVPPLDTIEDEMPKFQKQDRVYLLPGNKSRHNYKPDELLRIIDRDICSSLEYRVVLVGGSDDRSLAGEWFNGTCLKLAPEDKQKVIQEPKRKKSLIGKGQQIPNYPRGPLLSRTRKEYYLGDIVRVVQTKNSVAVTNEMKTMIGEKHTIKGLNKVASVRLKAWMFRKGDFELVARGDEGMQADKAEAAKDYARAHPEQSIDFSSGASMPPPRPRIFEEHQNVSLISTNNYNNDLTQFLDMVGFVVRDDGYCVEVEYLMDSASDSRTRIIVNQFELRKTTAHVTNSPRDREVKRKKLMNFIKGKHVIVHSEIHGEFYMKGEVGVITRCYPSHCMVRFFTGSEEGKECEITKSVIYVTDEPLTRGKHYSPPKVDDGTIAILDGSSDRIMAMNMGMLDQAKLAEVKYQEKVLQMQMMQDRAQAVSGVPSERMGYAEASRGGYKPEAMFNDKSFKWELGTAGHALTDPIAYAAGFDPYDSGDLTKDILKSEEDMGSLEGALKNTLPDGMKRRKVLFDKPVKLLKSPIKVKDGLPTIELEAVKSRINK